MAVILLIYDLFKLLMQNNKYIASIHFDFEHMITRHIVVEANNQRASNKYNTYG